MVKHKQLGQVFTPNNVAHEMIKLCDITNYHQCKIIDPACGTGAILLAVLDDIYLKHPNDIYQILQNNVYGFEIDVIAYQTCLRNLNTWLINHHLPLIKWHVYCCDTLLTYSQYLGYFDVVITNPPYVRSKNLSTSLHSFSFCDSGNSDLYLAFYEIGLKLLNSRGKLCFLNPSACFNSKNALKWRQEMLNKQYLTYIKDFEHQQIFKNATTYVCIILLDKQHHRSELIYENQHPIKFTYDEINLAHQWFFNTDQLFKTILQTVPKLVVQNGIATLCDNVFINDDLTADFTTVFKASTMTYHKVLFAYRDDLKLKSWDELQPTTQAYLNAHHNQIQQTKRDDQTHYWSFGRTQGLNYYHSYKVALGTLIKDLASLKCTILTPETLVYSGIYVVCDSIQQAQLIADCLNNQTFVRYIQQLRKYKSGGYYTFNTKDINKYLSYYLGDEISENRI